MASVNKCILIGNLGSDPEIRYTPSGAAVANFSLATTDKWTDKQGQPQERTEWHKIVVWGKLAELCGEYLSKGRQVYIEGSIQTRQWDDKEGNKRYTTEIKAREVTFLGSKSDAGPPKSRSGGYDGAKDKGQGNYGYGAPSNEEVPF